MELKAQSRLNNSKTLGRVTAVHLPIEEMDSVPPIGDRQRHKGKELTAQMDRGPSARTPPPLNL